MKIAFVSSAGGHFAQLYRLREWWSQHDRFWVTFERPDTVEALADERWYRASGPARRSVRGLLQNMPMALDILRTEQPDVVISSGAGMAIPWIYLARTLGIATVFIELPVRLMGPSMTGRAVRRFVDAVVVTHSAQRLFYPEAEQIMGVMPPQPMLHTPPTSKILVTVGTHADSFDRLVTAAESLTAFGPVVVQRGFSTATPSGCEVVDMLPPSAFEQLMEEARIIISHGGLATVDRVLAMGKLPIVVPRRPEFGEHVDDHQLQFAAILGDRALVVDDISALPHVVAGHSASEKQWRDRGCPSSLIGWSSADPVALGSAFGNFMDRMQSVCSGRRRGWRATFRFWTEDHRRS